MGSASRGALRRDPAPVGLFMVRGGELADSGFYSAQTANHRAFPLATPARLPGYYRRPERGTHPRLGV